MVTNVLVLLSAVIGIAAVSVATGMPGQGSGVLEVDPHNAFGSKTAPVTMEVYSDFQCPACKQLFKTTNQSLIDKDKQAGQLIAVNQTPTTVFHCKGQTYPYAGVMSYDILKQFLDQLLAQK